MYIVRTNPADRIIVALDGMSARQATEFTAELAPTGVRFKIGLGLIFSILMEHIRSSGHLADEEVRTFLRAYLPSAMLDPKLHDIPETMALAMREIATCSPVFVTVHASANKEGIRRAALAAPESCVLGVTVLTTFDERESEEVYRSPPLAAVKRLARRAHEAGVGGIVCAPTEIAAVREIIGPDKCIVTPGIRPAYLQVGTDDQKRVMTPSEAIKAGADFLVIGRPITKAAENGLTPFDAAMKIIGEVADAIDH